MTVIAEPFPQPPQVVVRVFEDLARVQVLTGSLGGRDSAIIEAELEQFGDLDLLPRPWDPPTCPPGVRGPLWRWLDDVAAWVNRGYAWKIDRVIPPCWPQHPHLAHELAVLACLRLQAGRAFTPDPLEEWHRWACPSFTDRMHARLGNGGCPPGKHTDWPARGRHVDYSSQDRRSSRHQLFGADTSAALRVV